MPTQCARNLIIRVYLTTLIPVGDGYDNNADGEVQNIAEWADNNWMVLNLDKTWEMVLTVRFTKLLTNCLRSSFEIPEVRYELSSFIT